MNKRAIKRKIKSWMRDSRYRDERKYVIVGVSALAFGLVGSLGLLLVENFSWILVGLIVFVITVFFLIWTFLNER